jgi:hypothetical protein
MSLILDGTAGLTFNNATTQTSGSKVLQVVQGSTATAVSSSTSAFVDTTLTATITPLFSTSKILVLVQQNGVTISNASASNAMDIQLVRGATGLGVFIGGLLNTNTALQQLGSTGFAYLDSPATTSATTYKTQFQSRNNTASVSVQIAGINTSFITLMEIAA